MGLYEDLLARIQGIPQSAGFPAGLPMPAERDPWDLPRLSDLPQTMLPPHMRRVVPAPDALSPGIQLGLNGAPVTPVPIAYQNAGMLPSLNPDTPVGLTETEKELMPDRALAVPMPRARPNEAPLADLPAPIDVAPAGTPDASVVTGPTDVSSRSRSPVQIAPPVVPNPRSPLADNFPAAGMLDGGVGGILGRLRTTLGDNSNTLLALGAGLAGAPNIGQGISRAAAAAIPARAADINQTLARQTRGMSTQALIAAGVPIQQAIAASGDPELKKALIQSYITDRKNEIKSVKTKDAFGGETERLYAVNPYDLTSKEITPGGDRSGGGAVAPGSPLGGKKGLFAEGVTAETFDHEAVGDAYLNQFGPEAQAGVKAYLRGDTLPAKSQEAQTIKKIAQKYGEDMGIPANDQDYVARKNFKASLGDVKNGVGLAVKGFQQGTAHLAATAEKMVKLGNYSLGLTDVGNAVNWMKNRTAKQGGIASALDADAQALAGEVGKLYSGSNGGGVHEREATKKLFGNPNATAEQQAGALEATLHLMEGGLNTLEGRKRQLFRDQEIPGGKFVTAEEERNIERVKNAIRVLRGEAAADKPTAERRPVAPGTYVWDATSGKLVPAK